MATYRVIETIETRQARRAAFTFSLLLATEKGVPSEVRRHARGYVVVADDRRAVLFARTGGELARG